jgi:hypothetical protein
MLKAIERHQVQWWVAATEIRFIVLGHDLFSVPKLAKELVQKYRFYLKQKNRQRGYRFFIFKPIQVLFL